ncbi:hypothetical protein AB7942_23600 [Neobacillus sp. BF23-41]|uniref:hypothetical protein n=1 Tax=Neobacillus sp. BF23-41 TaxID=3240280 RepID=UPI0034E45F45
MDQVHSPIGLELGSETTEEIAICIIGEIIKVSKEKKPMKVKQLNRYVKRRKAYFSTFLTCCKERFYIPEIHSYASKDCFFKSTGTVTSALCYLAITF